MPSTFDFETHPLVQSADPAERFRLLEQARVSQVPKGTLLFREGEMAECWTLLLAGYAKIEKSMPSGEPLLLRVFKAGDAISELPATASVPFPASATALTDCQILSLPCALYLEFRSRYAPVDTLSRETITERMRTLQARLGEIALPSVEARLAAFFVRLLAYAHEREGKFRIPFPLSRVELAEAANTRSETAIRTVRRWEKNGLLVTDQDGFTISSRSELERLSRG